TCKDIVLATHNPLVGLSNVAAATLFQTKLALYTSYVVGGRVPRGSVPGAMIAADGIMGRANPWGELFDPGRTKIRHAAWDYVTENKDYPYYLVRDRFAGAEGRTLRSVKRGEGKILDLKGSRVAAYRKEDGTPVVRSAVCTHMGCEVTWNTAERT